METKLATIICSDVIGYSSLMQRDEQGTLTKLDSCRAIIDKLILEYRGRLFNTGGDSVLIEFASAVDAVRFGVAMQAHMHHLNNGLRWRVGMHVGEVWIYGTNLMGDAVNLAARTESLADYGGVTLTDAVYRLVNAKIKDLKFISRGLQEFKNVEPMEIWSVDISGSEPNPHLNKQTIKPTKTKSHAELVNAILNDQAARNRTLNDAISFKHDQKYNAATRILMWRSIKNDSQAVDELINMLQKKLVPNDIQPYVYAVFREIYTKLSSETSLKIVELVKDTSHSLAMQILRHAARVNEQANQQLANMVFSDPHSSPSDIENLLGDLKESGLKRNISSMLNLGKYYLQIQDKKSAFRWLYAARAERNAEAQVLLEQLIKTISKTDFNNFKTDADALVDEIKFIDDNRMR